MADLTSLKLFATQASPCSYLDDRDSITVFVDPEAELDKNTYSQLSDYGFRRSGKHIYKPGCEGCNACTPVRIPVETFERSRSQQRCWKKNQDLTVHTVNSIDTDEHFALYKKYIELRHYDGDMYPAKQNEYSTFLQPQFGVTQYLEFRDTQNTLVGVAVTDILDQGLSAIYTFFDPEQTKRSLGVFGILAEIEWAKINNHDFVYLGYWIKDCQKMNYKTKYKPFQLLINQHWMTFG